MLSAKVSKSKKNKCLPNPKGRCASRNPPVAKSLSHRLKAGLFRHINNLLYTCTSQEAHQSLDKNQQRTFADIYHDGYQAQMKMWPVHPLDFIIERIKFVLAERGSDRNLIVDMGAGSCRLYTELTSCTTSIISVEFAPSTLVSKTVPIREDFTSYKALGGLIVSQMSKVAILPNKCADIVVFCLSLMGTDWPCFVTEGFRALKDDGIMYIADLTSRFPNLKALVKSLYAGGLKMQHQHDLEDGYFFVLALNKRADFHEFKIEKMNHSSQFSAPCV